MAVVAGSVEANLLQPYKEKRRSAPGTKKKKKKHLKGGPEGDGGVEKKNCHKPLLEI